MNTSKRHKFSDQPKPGSQTNVAVMRLIANFKANQYWWKHELLNWKILSHLRVEGTTGPTPCCKKVDNNEFFTSIWKSIYKLLCWMYVSQIGAASLLPPSHSITGCSCCCHLDTNSSLMAVNETPCQYHYKDITSTRSKIDRYQISQPWCTGHGTMCQKRDQFTTILTLVTAE